MTAPVTSYCKRTDGLHYHWYEYETARVECVDCGEFQHGIWLRCSDKRALCGACYEDPNRMFRREVVK